MVVVWVAQGVLTLLRCMHVVGGEGLARAGGCSATAQRISHAGALHADSVLYNPGGIVLSYIRKIVPTNPEFFYLCFA